MAAGSIAASYSVFSIYVTDTCNLSNALLFNITCKCREEKPSLRALLNGQRLEAHVYIERIPIEQVPENDKECDKWMYELYEKKVIIHILYIIICLIFRNYFEHLQLKIT